jgi:large subunit ribosomal protein L28
MIPSPGCFPVRKPSGGAVSSFGDAADRGRAVYGNKISHAHNVSRRRWEPNLQRVRALVDGSPKRIRVCTRCLRSGKVLKVVHPPRTAVA